MANEDAEQSTKNPSIGMRMTISMINKKFSKVTSISTSTLDEWIKEGIKDIITLDCRPEEEYNISHILEAVRVEYEDNADEILKSIPEDNFKNKTIVCYCSAGYRSSLVVDKIQDYFKKTKSALPFEIYNLEGSLFKWANEERVMVNVHNERTIYAHPYNPVFGKLLESHLRRNEVTNE